MKFSGYTDTEDWHWRTFVSMAFDRSCWSCGKQEQWRLRYLYCWYDGPIWQLEVGPFWISINCM